MGESQLATRQTTFISLRVRLLVAFLALFIVLFGGVFYWFYTFSDDLVQNRFYNFATDAAMDRLKEDLQTYLVGVAAEIDGDQFQALVDDQELAALVRAEEAEPNAGIYPDDPRYWEHVDLLGMVYQIDPRTGLYTYVAGDEPGQVVWIGSSGATKEEPSGAKFRQVTQFDPADAEIILAGLKETTFFLTIYEDQFGKWISGYTPIHNSAGETVGALGIDFRAEFVLEVQDQLRTSIINDVQEEVQNGIILAGGFTAIIVILTVYFMAGYLTRPMIELTRVAARIGEGDYEQDLSGLTPGRVSDEIGTLASVFEIMVGKVAKREEKLKQQVAELQIMIDESKRQEQVQEIVDSDFFRDLQEKARAMRQDFASRTGKPPTETPPED
jgi:HAMP domain-containing protein